MPWHGKQAQAIYLNVKRKKGAKAASRFMHAHGNRSPQKQLAHKRAKHG